MYYRWMMVAACLITVAFLPAVTHAASVTHERSKWVITDFTTTAGCIETNVFLGAIQESNAPGALVNLYIYQQNTCTGELLFGDSVSDVNVSQDVFQIQGNRAVFHGTVIGTDALANAIPMTVDLTWQATGSMTVANLTFHSHVPGCVVNAHTQYKTRLATAEGTVVVGSTNFTPNPSTYAAIQAGNDGSVQIGCDG